MKKVLSIVLVMVIMATMFTGCAGKASDQGSTGDVIKIAVAGPMTGDNAEYGKGFANAAQMKVDEWNANGGVLGKKIQIVAFDDKNSGEEAASIAQKIVSDKNIVGVVGHFASGVCMVAAPTYEDNQVIEISPSASHPDYSSIGDYIFRNNTVINAEAAAGLDIAINDLGKKNIGIISIKTDWGTKTSAIVKELITEKASTGAKVVAHEEVMEGSDDYSPAITKLNAAGADIVICVGMYNLIAPVAKQYKQVNPNIAIVGFSNSYSQQLLELGGSAVEGVRFPVIFFAGSDDPKVKSYVDEYTKRYGSTPSALTSQAYDSVAMLLECIKSVGSVDREKIREALAGIKYEGVTGHITFNEIGDVQKDFIKVVIKDGKFEAVK